MIQIAIRPLQSDSKPWGAMDTSNFGYDFYFCITSMIEVLRESTEEDLFYASVITHKTSIEMRLKIEDRIKTEEEESC